MEPISVEVTRLVETLKKNRDEHRDIFLKAQSVYREKVIEAFEERLESIRNGEKIVTWINLPEPEDHTQDFNDAIEMLEWETRERIELSPRDFKRYVQNRWEWEASFTANTRSYSQMLDDAEQA